MALLFRSTATTEKTGLHAIRSTANTSEITGCHEVQCLHCSLWISSTDLTAKPEKQGFSSVSSPANWSQVLCCHEVLNLYFSPSLRIQLTEADIQVILVTCLHWLGKGASQRWTATRDKQGQQRQLTSRQESSSVLLYDPVQSLEQVTAESDKQGQQRQLTSPQESSFVLS